jgi:hypothetical protein
MADTQQFTGIDEAKWDRIKAAIKAKTGITVTSDVGDQHSRGVELSWSFNAQTTDLTVTLVKRSFYDPDAATIDKAIAKLVADA